MRQCLRGAVLVCKWECASFFRAGGGSLLIYLALIPAWGWLMQSRITGSGADYLWFLFFSVVVCGLFSSSVFTAERLSGALELLFLSGLSRASILAGKTAFVSATSVLMGFFCYGFAVAVSSGSIRTYLLARAISDIPLFASACVMNTLFDAWLSFRLGNPRVISIVNLGALMGIAMVGEGLRVFVPWSQWWAIVFFSALAVLFWIVTIRQFRSEKMLKPVVY